VRHFPCLAKANRRALHRAVRILTLVAIAAGTADGRAQAWPARPVRVLLGYTPGGANDGALRPLARLLEVSLGQPIIIEYKPGTSGIAGPHHMAGEYFKRVSGASLQHVPYKGGAQAMNDLMGGQIPLLFSSMGPAVGPVKAGRIRALAVTTARRSVALPEVPTLDEAGLKGFDSSNWLGFVGPAGLPAEVVQRFSQALHKAGEDRALQDSFNAAGCEPEARNPAQMRERITADLAKWGKLIRDAGIKAE
jgi:tripartite-type tricarboxylate transporter receptor subunit TctC